MMKHRRKLQIFFSCLTAVFAVMVLWIAAGCRNVEPVLLCAPQEASRQAEQLMEAFCSGDFSGAEECLLGKPDLGAGRPPRDPVGSMIWEVLIQSLDYELVGTCYATDRGLAQDVKLIGLELDTLTQNLGTRARTLLQQRIEAAEDISELYDENNAYREDLVQEVLRESVCQALAEDLRYTYEILPLDLVYDRDQWWVAAGSGSSAVMDKFDNYITNVLSDALEGILAIDKVYWLQDEDLAAPKPDPKKYGKTSDPRDLEPVITHAEKLLQGQSLVFQWDAEIREDSEITYYLDETILCITWQHMVGGAVYTCSEVKIAHPSQFRRFLSDGEFGSGKLYRATEMAASVNAVTASNGDYYGFRGYGNLVYNGEVMMAENRYLDTCYVDRNGDLILKDMGTIYKKEDVEAFVAENDIRFSLAFGPILVEDGKVTAKYYYALGETDSYYSRAALCQVAPLHYLLVTVNRRGQDVLKFAKHLQELGVDKAYALDGGQTSTIVTGNELMNPVDYGGERETSDIIYFATAVPDGG